MSTKALQKMSQRSMLAGIFALAGLVAPVLAFALTPTAITINPNIPGSQNVAQVGPCGWIVNFYDFALIIAGVLAFGAVVYGGFLYATSAGNASKQSEGRSWILSALVGVLLLAGAYLILYTINPNLVTCSLPTLAGVGAPPGGGVPSGGGGPTGGNCASGQCQTLPKCTHAQGNLVTGQGTVNCGGAQGMVNTLSCINKIDPAFNVSEGYPPAVHHASPGHNNGCSVDTVVTGGNCLAVNALMSAAAQCGTTAINEYTSCGGKNYTFTTGGNVHINAAPGQGGC